MNALFTILSHPVFLSAVLAWLGAQCIKLVLDLMQRNPLEGDFLLRSGGMPSSHSAFVSALTLSVYLLEGITTEFIIALCLSIIVIADALGVRRQVGHQATLLNLLLKEIKPLLRKKLKLPIVLKELVGHSGAQVIVGCLLGIVVSLAVYLHL
jgi:uncharacterized protein